VSVLPDPLPIEPVAAPLAARLRAPGSKSATNRAIVLAALASGRSRLEGILVAEDTLRLVAGFEALGVRVAREGDCAVVEGCGGRLPRGGAVDLGDGGTPTRFLIAAATLAAGPVVVDGSARMRERPVEEGIALLRRLGARIETTERVVDGKAVEALPVVVHPSAPLAGGRLEVGRTASSQFLSALLLIAPTFAAPLELSYSEPPTSASYLELTVEALATFGVEVATLRDDGRLRGHRVAPQPIRATEQRIEPDASSAAYAALAAAIVPGSRVLLEGLSLASRQPDLRFLGALSAMGVGVEAESGGILVVGPDSLAGIDIDASDFPDAAIALAVACARASGPSVLRGLRTLRVKESDRLAALATELSRVGACAAIEGDALRIDPGDAARRGDPVAIETYRDHRMAMAFAILGLVRSGISIVDPRCVGKSYPDFWSDLARLRRS
jgi:3-phosphoshikimate 1-carboxyvinyltransferase